MRLNIFLYFIIIYAIISQTFAENTHRVKCPCFATISIPRSATKHNSYDIIIRRINNPIKSYIDERLSRRNVFPEDPGHAKTDFVWHQFKPIAIPTSGHYTITVHPSRKSSVPAPDSFINLKATARQVSCPVLISQQLPEVRMVQNEQPPVPPHKIVNGSFSWLDRQFEQEQREADQRIVGGAFINNDLLPYVVAILGPPGRRTLCTGALLSARWVVTAAHCQTQTNYKVVVGATQAFVDGTEFGISEVFNNPRYGPSGRETFWDIALIQLDRAVTEEGFNNFMKINLNSNYPQDGAIVRVAGFGVTSFLSTIPDPFPQRLRQVDLPVTTNKVCKLAYRRATSLIVSKRWQFCAGYTEGGCDSCQGDSGGPLIQYVGAQPVLLGLVSSGAGCASAGFPGINSRVSAFESFLISSGAEYTEHTGNIPQIMANCPPGQFLFSSGGNVATCRNCPSRGFSRGGTSRTCRLCPKNSRQDPTNGAVCNCKAVPGSGQVKRRCRPCDPGQFSANGQNDCSPCPAGTFSSSRGASSCDACTGAAEGSSSCP